MIVSKTVTSLPVRTIVINHTLYQVGPHLFNGKRINVVEGWVMEHETRSGHFVSGHWRLIRRGKKHALLVAEYDKVIAQEKAA